MKRILNAARARAGELAEHSTEAGCACAIMMVQGQLAMLSVAHWIVALQTGLISGVAATILVVLAKATRPWAISVIVGAVTTIVDFLIHSGRLLPVLVEALLTGLAAGLLALLITSALRLLAQRLRNRAS